MGAKENMNTFEHGIKPGFWKLRQTAGIQNTRIQIHQLPSMSKLLLPPSRFASKQSGQLNLVGFSQNLFNFLDSSVRKKDLVRNYFILHHMCKTLTDKMQVANSVKLAFHLHFQALMHTSQLPLKISHLSPTNATWS